MLTVFLCVIVFQTIAKSKETDNYTPYVKWGVVSLKAPLRGIFQSSPVLIAGQVKNLYQCAWVVYPSGVKLLLSANQESAKWSLGLFYITFATPTPLYDNTCVQLNAALPQTVKLGPL